MKTGAKYPPSIILPPPLFFFLLLWIILDITAVRPEEEYLERKFDNRYLEYKAEVRRWL
jgi:protein-S-isoprenylcysteine O-methyltransferase Ste14